MECLEVSGAVRPIYESLGVKRLSTHSLTLMSHVVTATMMVLLTINRVISGGYFHEKLALLKTGWPKLMGE